MRAISTGSVSYTHLVFGLELCDGGLVLGGAAGAHAVFAVALGVAMAGEAQRGQALRLSLIHI